MSILEEILANKRKEVDTAKQNIPLGSLKIQAKQIAENRITASFTSSLKSHSPFAIIAEIKRSSPSKGPIRADLDPVATAAAYAKSGAACISVLTDKRFFSGDLKFLSDIKSALPNTPLLRKDFILDPYQIWETAASNADAVLLIVGALSNSELLFLYGEALLAGLDVLIEVHNEMELLRVMELLRIVIEKKKPLPMLGINNRDLHSFEVDIETTEKLINCLRKAAQKLGIEQAVTEVVIVAESGITSGADVVKLCQSGAQAFLIGESLLTQGDPGVNLAQILNDSERLFIRQ